METYIALLRGVNVSGKNTIKMDTLRQTLTSKGFTNVQTYIQSGNVVFQSTSKDPYGLAKELGSQITSTFNLEVPVIVMPLYKLRSIVAENPFAGNEEKTVQYLHVTFLASPPDCTDLSKLRQKQLSNEEIALTKDALYLYCPHGYGNTKLHNANIEKHLHVTATTRNWNITQNILGLAQNIANG
ncbi:MAG: DUF1697 domain-containing protein [Breznakibacter sp.]